MRWWRLPTKVGVALLTSPSLAAAQSFTTSNGQIFTPGFVVLNAPQPGTPLGGGAYYKLATAPMRPEFAELTLRDG